MKNRIQKFSLLVGDIAILYLSLYITLLIRYQKIPTTSTWEGHLLPFSIAFFVWIIIFYISDLYNIHLATNNPKFFSLTLRASLIASLLTVVFFYINPNINIAPKTNLIIYIIIFIIFFLLWRRLFNIALFKVIAKEKILIIGYNEKIKELIQVLDEKPHLGYKIVLIVSEEKKIITNNVPVINDYSKIQSIAKNQKISTIIVGLDTHHLPKLRSSLFSLLPLKINFITLANFYESITGKIAIDQIDETWFLENLSEGGRKWFDIFKRAYDILLSLLILILTLPFWLVVIIVIKLESKGPAFFMSLRSGKNDKSFKLIKFRTMKEDDNDRSLTKANDPRVTSFGRFLRRSRIDEIPQIINVLLGQISFVGPRPERPEFIKTLKKEIPFYSQRMLVKPGATGWDQVSGEYHSPTVEDSFKKLQYDLFYVKNRSPYLDLSIILKTIATILRRGGI